MLAAMRTTGLSLTLVAVLTLAAPAHAAARHARLVVRTVPLDRPTSFSVRDALLGAAAAGVLIGVLAAVGTWRVEHKATRRR
jgi:hypothetical protein